MNYKKYKKIKSNEVLIETFLSDILLNYIESESTYYPEQTPGIDSADKIERWKSKCKKNAKVILNSKNDKDVSLKLYWVIKNKGNFK